MNVLQLSKAIGATVLVSFPAGDTSIGVYCEVEDVRKVYDRVDLLVHPIAGCGRGWVSLQRVERTPNGICTFNDHALTA